MLSSPVSDQVRTRISRQPAFGICQNSRAARPRPRVSSASGAWPLAVECENEDEAITGGLPWRVRQWRLHACQLRHE